jgi:hypothetical protein
MLIVLLHALDPDAALDQPRQQGSPAHPENMAPPSLLPGFACINLLGNWTL